MGYTTTFEGSFQLDPPLTREQRLYLTAFSETRRMKRDGIIAATFPDPLRKAAGLSVGPEGEFFVGGSGYRGEGRDASIVKYNHPPVSQPDLWCQWVPNEAGTRISWNGDEKFYCYVEWLDYLIETFLLRWGIQISGEVSYEGEDFEDWGVIRIVNGTPVKYPKEVSPPPPIKETPEEEGWKPINTAPAEGVFLVWLEEPFLRSHVHTMNKRPNITSIATHFDFDCPKATHWRPHPAPPKEDP